MRPPAIKAHLQPSNQRAINSEQSLRYFSHFLGTGTRLRVGVPSRSHDFQKRSRSRILLMAKALFIYDFLADIDVFYWARGHWGLRRLLYYMMLRTKFSVNRPAVMKVTFKYFVT